MFEEEKKCLKVFGALLPPRPLFNIGRSGLDRLPWHHRGLVSVGAELDPPHPTYRPANIRIFASVFNMDFLKLHLETKHILLTLPPAAPRKDMYQGTVKWDTL